MDAIDLQIAAAKKEYIRNYYLANKEKLKLKGKIYYETNKTAIIQKQKEYKKANKDKNKDKNKQYRKKYNETHNQIIECECGIFIKSFNIEKHKKTKKHIFKLIFT